MPMNEEVRKAVTCPHCRQSWKRHCDQHASIELFGECIPCRFMPDGKGTREGTQDDIAAIQAKRQQWVKAHLSEPRT
jgi:hypothetical protein